jgi:hypothetical protein
MLGLLISTLLATAAAAAASSSGGQVGTGGGSSGDDALRRIERELDQLGRSLEIDLPRIERQRTAPVTTPPAQAPETRGR